MSKYWYDESQRFGTIPQDVLLSTSGLELARKIVAGELPAPSMGKALNFRMAEADEGRVVFRGSSMVVGLLPFWIPHWPAVSGRWFPWGFSIQRQNSR
jgi:hypothetical protein